MTEQARADVQESRDAITDMKQQIAAIEQEKAQAMEQLNDRWGDIANQVDEIQLAPLKKDVLIDLFGVAWVPYYIVQAGSETIELPAHQ
jgi:predicted  nucleic acid-binding Zn-ribbon protein